MTTSDPEGLMLANFPEFPRRLHLLRVKSGNGISISVPEASNAVVEKLRHLYTILKSIAEQLPSKIDLNEKQQDINYILHVSRKLIKQANIDSVQLPEWLSARFCESCGCFLVPGVTSQYRLKSFSKGSKINKAERPKAQNQLVIKCLKCQNIVKQSTIYTRQEKAKFRVSRKRKIDKFLNSTQKVSEKSPSSIQSPPAKLARAMTEPSQNSEKQRFSFLNRSAVVSSPVSDFIPFNSNNKTVNSITRNNISPKINNEKLTGHDMRVAPAYNSKPLDPSNLLYIEQQRKLEKKLEKKRKTS